MSEIKRKLPTRRKTPSPVTFKGLVNRRREPGEIPNRRQAIMNFCSECMGWDAGGFGSIRESVRQCTAKECWLYPYRAGSVTRDEGGDS